MRSPSKASGAVIAVDALAARFGGTAYAGVQIVEALARRADVREVAVVVRPHSIVERGLRGIPKVRKIVVANARPELVRRVAWEAARLPALLARLQADGLLTLAAMLPRFPHCPVVGLQANPVPYESGGVGAEVRRRAVAWNASRAHATYVPSAHVAALVGDLPRVRVVPLGVDRTRFRPTTVPGEELLCVADFYPHKHHELLLEMHRRLPNPRPILRLIGNPDVSPRCFARISAAAGHDDVVVSGRVPFAELVDAYARARLFVIASDRESFCMPLAEAIVAGVPAVARDHPALRETGGPGAEYVAGDDPAAWARVVGGLLADERALATLRAAGREHGRRFSWDAFAERLMSDLLRSDRVVL